MVLSRFFAFYSAKVHAGKILHVENPFKVLGLHYKTSQDVNGRNYPESHFFYEKLRGTVQLGLKIDNEFIGCSWICSIL